MNTTLSLLLVLPVLAIGAQNRAGAPVTPPPAPASACPAGATRGDCPLGAVDSTTPTSLSAAALVFAIEEERVAHDIYAAAFARWNLRVFANIADAETRHAAAITQLAATIGVQPPVTRPGVYVTADLQALYDQLIVLVNGSETGALRAGALIEETDITDLRRSAALATDEPTKAVLAQLEQASVHHLAAFVRNLSARGTTYVPQVLAADEFATMTSAAPGRCGAGECRGGPDGTGGPASANGSGGRGYRGGR